MTQRRSFPWLAAALLAVIVAATVGVYLVMARQQARANANACVTELGPVDRISQRAGIPLRLEPISAGRMCDVWLQRRDAATTGHDDTVVSLSDDVPSEYAERKRDLDAKSFSGHKTFAAGRYTVDLYFADGPKMTTEELEADVQRRVGTSADPTGDALEAAPPDKHMALIRHGDVVTAIALAPDVFDDARAEQLVRELVAAWP